MPKSVTVCLCLLCSLGAAFAQGSSIGTATTFAPNGSAGAGMDNTSFDHYWKVTTTQDGYLRLQVASSAGLDVDITLYDVNGTTVLMSDMQSGVNSEVFGFLQPGTFYLRVTRWSGTTGSYTIASVFQAPSRSADPEPNGLPASATALNPNATSTGHLCYASAGQLDTLDYWKITTSQDGWLRLQLRTDSLDARGDQTFDADMILFDVDGTTQITSDQGSGSFSQVAAYLRPGTYFVRIQRWTGRAATYEISSQLTLPLRANDVEGNDWFAAASTLSLITPGTGHIGYYSNGSTDYGDFWKITAPGTDSIYIHLTSDASLDLDLTGYGPDTSLSIAADGGTGTYSRIGIKPAAGSTYYCKVTYWSGTAGSYSIVASSSGVPVDVGYFPEREQIPAGYVLAQNYPNPFNPITMIRYELPVAVRVDLRVFDLLGREVAVLASGLQQAGNHTVTFNAGGLGSGTYICRLSTPGYAAMRRMVLVR